MNNFNDRIYLLLTLQKKEILEYYLQTIAVIIAVAAYNLIGLFIHTPIAINYWSLLVALVLVSCLFGYLKTQALPIDWELLNRVSEEIKEVVEKPVEAKESEIEEPVVTEEIIEEVSTNEEIQMVDVEDDAFDFGDSLASLYNMGTPKQLSDVAVNGIEQKVRRMNLH